MNFKLTTSITFIQLLKKMFIFIIGIPLFTFHLNAQSKPERLDSMLTALYKNNQFSGTVLVAEKGKIVFSKSFGWADFENKDTLKLNTTMPIASITKQFTAMGIMMLKERGLLNYDDNIKKYLPEVDQKNVTIRHLLNHTSGLDINGSNKGFRYMEKNAISKDGISIIDKELMLKCYSKKIPQPDFIPPGKKFQYSNGGYTLLASIIERVSGLSYCEFMQKNIFDPVQMRNTFILRPAIMNDKKVAYSYKLSLFKGLKRVTDYYNKDQPIKKLVLLDGDKHIYSTVEDMFKWDQALYTELLVSKKTLKEAFTPGILNDGKKNYYGFGWFLFPGKDSAIVEHTGGIENYSSGFQRRTANGSTTILLLNAHPYNLGPVWTGMLNVLNNEPFNPYVFPKKTILEKMTYRKFKKHIEIKT